MKKLYEANKCWNDNKCKLNCHKLEWVNLISWTKSNKLYSVSPDKFYLDKGDITSHWVGHSALKELDTIEFFVKRAYDWGYGSWTDWIFRNKFKTEDLAVTEEADVDEVIPVYL